MALAPGCYGWAFLKTLYTASTLGFASVHDPQRDAYDAGKISGLEYTVKGIGGGGALVAANVMTGRAAGVAMAGKTLLQQTVIGAATGTALGAGNDAAAQLSNIDTGVQQGYNLKQTAISALVGGAIGGAAPTAGLLIQNLSERIAQTRIGSYLTGERGPGLKGILADSAAEQAAIRERVIANIAESENARSGSGFAAASRKWTIRENILSNIEESKAARNSSNFEVLAKAERSPSTYARAWQGNVSYPGVDKWSDIVLKKGTKVWGGAPGQTPFYTTQKMMKIAGNDATKIFKGLQVGKGKYPTYREGMTMYELREDTVVANSKALANPKYGVPGGFDQYFIRNYEDVLNPIKSIILKNR